jgi:hypothetical protein
MRGGGDRPIANEVAATSLPLTSNDDQLWIEWLGRRFGVLPVHLLEDGCEGFILLLRRLAIELIGILSLVTFFPRI